MDKHILLFKLRCHWVHHECPCSPFVIRISCLGLPRFECRVAGDDGCCGSLVGRLGDRETEVVGELAVRPSEGSEKPFEVSPSTSLAMVSPECSVALIYMQDDAIVRIVCHDSLHIQPLESLPMGIPAFCIGSILLRNVCIAGK